MNTWEGRRVITPRLIDSWDALDADLLGLWERVGVAQFALMLRAKQSREHALMTSGERERLAARRLVARGLLIERFPGAGPGHPLHRRYLLTERGRECWVVSI